MRKRCCFCGQRRPADWRKAGWRGVHVIERGQVSHWCCPLHDWKALRSDLLDHAEAVADGDERCKWNTGQTPAHCIEGVGKRAGVGERGGRK